MEYLLVSKFSVAPGQQLAFTLDCLDNTADDKTQQETTRLSIFSRFCEDKFYEAMETN